MPLYAILVREYFGARIMGTIFGAVAFVSTLGMALGPWAAARCTTRSAATSGVHRLGRYRARGRGHRLTFRPPRQLSPRCEPEPRPLSAAT